MSAMGLLKVLTTPRSWSSRSAPAHSESSSGRRNLTLGQIVNIASAMRLGVDISFVRGP